MKVKMLKYAFKLKERKGRVQYLYLRSSANCENFLTVEASTEKQQV